MSTKPSRSLPFAVVAGLPVLALSAGAQTQSLAFTGGVLLNTSVSFHHLGSHTRLVDPGPATGATVDRTYDDGFNRVDATGNYGDTTVNYGYLSGSQIGPDGLRLSAGTASGNGSIEDAGSFVEPSGNLEYRGSLGPLGSADWGILLGIGYQFVGGRESQSFVTDAEILEDRFSLGGAAPGDLPSAPYSGSADASGPRIGSVPSRSTRGLPGGHRLDGTWELSADLIPITGGLYVESQIAGRLNVVASAGFLAVLVNSEFESWETSVIDSLPAATIRQSDSENDFVFGGFVQVGLDWALWENASLVASARWQPAETFSHSADGRSAEIDFTAAFAVHAGFAMRF